MNIAADAEYTKDIEKYGDALIKAWEHYLRIVDLLLTMSAATAAVLTAFLKDLGTRSPYLLIGSVIFLALTFVFMAFWRVGAQHFYEYETIGSPSIAKRYFSYHEIDKPITRAFAPQESRRQAYRRLLPFASAGSGLLLGLTWAFLILHLLLVAA